MLEKKQILPIGSRVAVRYAADGGKETLLLILGHLSLKNATLCYYDYICVYEEFGIERGVVYINHTDIVCIVHRYDPSDEAYERWLARKYPEYVAYYENGNPENRLDIDTMRAMTLNARDREYRKNRIKKLARYTCMGFCTLGVGLTVLLTNRWEMAVGALFFIFFGMGMKK